MLLPMTVKAPAVLGPAGLSALGAFRRFAAWCARCHARSEQRRDLAALDERLLKDVGIAPRDAAEESAKPWWRP